ncbi:HK97-gp10 family putative phage morphogenesis protein [Limosilactobacillus fermentum]|uniref:HK97-gp10 family putative phage morphogenesis protein n=1 Tax=Limosilactobacillus fermentum TaxID=1613 RepID=UPI000F4FD641|nr:HK97-gp10 family putative phage morphogenesis protein [Limosilactobacillus fermentum]
MDFEDIMTGLSNIDEKVIPDTTTKRKMTEAGAKVLAEKLKEATPRTKRNDVKYGHLQDNVTYQDTDIDGEENGSSTVGYGKKAYVARFLNDGTVKMPATHFVDNVRRESSDEVFKAQREAYDKLMRGDR